VAYVEVATRAVMVTVFVVAVWGKARRRADWREFVTSVRAFEVVPPRTVGAVAALAGGLEAATVVLLLVPGTAVLGYAVGAGLLAAFAGAMALSRRRGAQPVCRCFGGRGAAVSAVHVTRNLVLIVAALAAGTLRWFASGPAQPAGAVVAALAGVLLAAFIVRLDDLVALFTPISTSRTR
jgi:hypothetical protein